MTDELLSKYPLRQREHIFVILLVSFMNGPQLRYCLYYTCVT